MANKISLTVSLLIFVLAPAILVGLRYSYVLGFGAFCLLSALWGIYLSLLDIARAVHKGR